MSEIERILDNKPSRPPMISTLALRWQSMCPHGSGGGSLEEAGSPKSEGGNSQDQEQTKEVNNKMPFCEIQWSRTRQTVSLLYDIGTQHRSWRVAKDWHGCDSISRLRFLVAIRCWSNAHTTTSRHDNIYQLRRNSSPETRRLSTTAITSILAGHPELHARFVSLVCHTRGHS